MTKKQRGPLTMAAIQRSGAGRRVADPIPENPERCVADLILDDPAIAAWIAKAGDDDQCDRRARSLVTAIGDFYGNARLPWRTPAEHTRQYRGRAAELLCLARAMRADHMPAMQRHAKALVLAAKDAKQIAQSPEMWTQPRPHHADAARNDFMRAMSSGPTCWWREMTRKPKYEFTATITNIMFDLKDDAMVDASTVETICRQKSTFSS